jgi:hypothetical protein
LLSIVLHLATHRVKRAGTTCVLSFSRCIPQICETV